MGTNCIACSWRFRLRFIGFRDVFIVAIALHGTGTTRCAVNFCTSEKWFFNFEFFFSSIPRFFLKYENESEIKGCTYSV